ncbi:MAG: hypothetical protein H0V44_06480, partial [Planctomycetes bacterium]|nr:hypothetical protein [Planctomycetota bacterium]
LQEPLRMVSSYLGLLKRKSSAKLDDQERGYLDRAVDGASRMSQMVRDLLAFASADSAIVTKMPVESSEIVGDALKNLSLKITEVQATITVAELPSISGDRMLLAQVFQNLLSNGIKFRGDRNPDLVVSASRQDDQHLFRVQDNGIGIPSESVDHIFGLFQRLHGADEYPGTGIGLSLCKRIVERHGGHIGVESVVGTGSTFWFSIPA